MHRNVFVKLMLVIFVAKRKQIFFFLRKKSIFLFLCTNAINITFGMHNAKSLVHIKKNILKWILTAGH